MVLHIVFVQLFVYFAGCPLRGYASYKTRLLSWAKVFLFGNINNPPSYDKPTRANLHIQEKSSKHSASSNMSLHKVQTGSGRLAGKVAIVTGISTHALPSELD